MASSTTSKSWTANARGSGQTEAIRDESQHEENTDEEIDHEETVIEAETVMVGRVSLTNSEAATDFGTAAFRLLPT